MIELVYDIAVVSDYKVVRSNHILQCCIRDIRISQRNCVRGRRIRSMCGVLLVGEHECCGWTRARE